MSSFQKLIQIHKKSMKNLCKFCLWKIEGPKYPKKWIWEGLGLHLERVWGGLGPLLAALGRLLLVFWTFNMQLFSSMGPTLAPRGLLDRFWDRLGRIWAGFGEGLGRNLEGFGCFLAGLGHFLETFGKIWPCWGKASKLDPRADPRSVTMRGGSTPAWLNRRVNALKQ